MKILIINSNPSNNFSILLPFFSKLQNKYGHSYEFLTVSNYLLKSIKENNWSCKKSFFPFTSSQSFFTSLLLLITLPLLQLFYIAKFLICKNHKKSSTVILVSAPEKIFYTIPAKFFKKKIIWISIPRKKERMSKIFKKLLRCFSRYAKTVVFTDSEMIRLTKNGFEEDKISVLYFGIDANNHTHQKNIFSEIAETKVSNNVKSKFFTVGTITKLDDTREIEILFSSIKKCVTIIPNIQFIVVGDGKMRKNLTWIAKKMEINNLVWFVGEQKHTRKWLDSFDTLVMVNEYLGLPEIRSITEAMSAGVPIIAPYNVGLEYIIDDNKNGILIDTNNSENIATQIIRIQQNKHLQSQLNTSSKETIDKYFILDKMVNNFNDILK